MATIETATSPHWRRYRVQGENRFIAEVFQNQEQKTASGLVVPNTRETQAPPTTGRVLARSEVFDETKFPDVKVGAMVKVMLGGWDTFDEGRLAFGMAESVIAVYNMDWDCTQNTTEEAAA